MREFLEIMALAVLQGVTEFLPISSSGHLVLAQNILKMNPQGVQLEVVLHLGTMVSIMAYYRAVLLRLVAGFFKGERKSLTMLGYILLSALPAAFFYFLCHDKIEGFYEDPHAVGGFLIFTGVVLCVLRWLRCGHGEVDAPRAFLIGLAQALAILPGVSRSGLTISAARMAGVAVDKAAEFSFLMCLPLLAGAAFLDMLGGGATNVPATSGWLLAFGAVVAALVGYGALSLLVGVLRSGRFWIFGVYCILVGLLTIACV